MKIYLPVMLLFVGNMLISSENEIISTITAANYDVNYKIFFTEQHAEALKRLSKQSQSKESKEKADADYLLGILCHSEKHRKLNEKGIKESTGSNQPS